MQVPCQEIVQIGRSLCSQYIRSRLKRSGFLNKKCGLQRLRSAVSLPCGVVFREVFPELLGLGLELERLHPKLYSNVVRQASSAPGGRLTNDKEAGAVLSAISRELLKQVKSHSTSIISTSFLSTPGLDMVKGCLAVRSCWRARCGLCPSGTLRLPSLNCGSYGRNLGG